MYSKEEVILICASDDLSRKRPPLLRALQERSCPPLGLLYLAAVLEKEKIKSVIIDLARLKGGLGQAIQGIGRSSPKVIGVYVTSFDLCLVKRLISGIREVSKGSKIVIGGPHVNYCPDSVIYLNADFGIISDGEYGLLGLVKELLNNGSDFMDIPNLIARSGSGIRVNGLKMIEDLDSLPFPARHLWPYRFSSPLFAGKITSTVTSRGCVFQCSFCGVPNKGTLRARSVGNVIEEFGYLQRQGFDYVELLDDTFTYDRSRVQLFCETLIKIRNKLKWTCLTRIDCVNRELLRLMKKAKCTHVKYGIETGSEFIRNKIMKKSITNGQVESVIRETREAGIFAEGCFMLAEREESLQDIRSTVEFIKKLKLDYIDFHLTWLVPGSEILKKALSEQRISPDIWRQVAEGKPVPFSTPDTISLPEIIALRKKIMRDFYFSPGFLFKEILTRTKDLPSAINKITVLLSALNLCRR